MKPETRFVMNGKPVFQVPAKSIINFDSAFRHKLLCDGPTFSAGSACVYRCSFCYVPDIMRKSPHLSGIREKHEDVVIRRAGAVDAMRKQLTDARGNPKFYDFTDTRVIYASPLVDVAGNMELVRETIELCKVILELTCWQIRLLSKSNLLPKIAEGLDGIADAKRRIIYGVSTGTLDDNLARVFERDCPLVSKRIASLHWLQDHGYRTFGMICPSLPQTDYNRFAQEMAEAIRAEKCEHIWAEVINVRGDSYTNTFNALKNGGFKAEAHWLQLVFSTTDRWETYARKTFDAHAPLYSPGKLRFLQYVTANSRAWWEQQRNLGVVIL
ncbi:MAG TPA: hypothetical protein VFM25_03970 [Verrucomicrobiae bacterium]|nr:hypothetical protein [Verrucomicrobiae bacterium]